MRIFQKTSIFFILILFLYGCGYTAVYKNQNNLNFKISVIDSLGDRKINNLIKAKLKRYELISTDVNYNVVIETDYENIIVTKDATGAVTNYRISISVNFKVSSEDFDKQFKYTENFDIKKGTDKIDEINYEKNIQNNLVEIIIRKFITQLALIK
jgi:hypothetical protein